MSQAVRMGSISYFLLINFFLAFSDASDWGSLSVSLATSLPFPLFFLSLSLSFFTTCVTTIDGTIPSASTSSYVHQGLPDLAH